MSCAMSKGLHEIDYDEVTTGLRDIISEFEITIPVHSEEVRHLEYQVNIEDNLVLNESKVEKWHSHLGTVILWTERLLIFGGGSHKCGDSGLFVLFVVLFSFQSTQQKSMPQMCS